MALLGVADSEGTVTLNEWDPVEVRIAISIREDMADRGSRDRSLNLIASDAQTRMCCVYRWTGPTDVPPQGEHPVAVCQVSDSPHTVRQRVRLPRRFTVKSEYRNSSA
jgi:hypothetical protein